MPRRWSSTWRQWTLGVGIAVLLAGAGLLVVAACFDLGTADNIGSVVGGVTSALGLAITLVSRWPSQSNMDDAEEAVEATVRTLATLVKGSSAHERQRLRIHDPGPLSVNWHTVADEFVDHWPNIQNTLESTQTTPLDLDGTIAAIRKIYQAIPSGRLVILGKPGSGKTVLAHLLILSMLKGRQPVDQVPVLFSLSGWDPGALPLRDWLAEQLRRDYNLDGDAPDGDLASHLVQHGRVLPVLDGFDELAPGYRQAAIEKINGVDGPFVVTSRPDEYTEAVSRVDVLTGAAGIKLEDLTSDKVEHYLSLSGSKTRVAAWEPVFQRLRDAPDDPASQHLGQVLSTPLMVTSAPSSVRVLGWGLW